MATIHFRDVAKTAILTALLADIDFGAAPAILRIYKGAMPATPETAISTGATGVDMLAEITLADPVATITGSGSTLVLEFSGMPKQDTSADVDGTASFFRIFQGTSGTAVFDGDVSLTGASGTLQLNTTAIKALGPVIITSFKISVP